jgi:signal transduction histidine kinase
MHVDIDTLLAKVEALEAENSALKEKAWDSILYGMVSKIVHQTEDNPHTLDHILKQISFYKKLSFCACVDVIGSQLKILGYFSAFNDFQAEKLKIIIPEIDDLFTDGSDAVIVKKADFEYYGIAFRGISHQINARKLLILRCKADSIPDKYFIFVDTGNDEGNLENSVTLLLQVTQLVVEHMDKLAIFNELTNLNQELDRRVAERTLEYLKAKEKAEESDLLKTAFLQNMSHEIRTPLNAIMGFADLLPLNFDDEEKLAKFANIIKQRGFDLLDIINGILDFAKIEAGHLAVFPEKCNMNEFADKLYAHSLEFQNRVEKEHINFKLNIPKNVRAATIIIDQAKLRQILMNLIRNAFKFTTSGTIEVGCSFVDEQTLSFYVTDTGIGISKEKHNDIFTRFIKASQNPSHFYGGTGLGLSIVKGMLNIMGGKIWLESEVGKGSTFYFNVPFEAVHPIIESQIQMVEEHRL